MLPRLAYAPLSQFFFVLGSIVVHDSSQFGCTFSFRHLLNAFNKPFLIFLFLAICFIVSALTPSVPAAFPFFCLFIIFIISSSVIIGIGIILLPPFAMFSSSSLLIISFRPILFLDPYQNVRSISSAFWYISLFHVSINRPHITSSAFFSPST